MRKTNKRKFILKNCFDDLVELEIDMTEVRYIFREVVSGDEIFTVVYNNGIAESFDSDMHFRCQTFREELEMIYPERIDLYAGERQKPGEVKNFKCIKYFEEAKNRIEKGE